MSQTLFVEYRGQGFWVFDVTSGILLKHLIDAATPRATPDDWLSRAIRRWRVSAVVPDLGFHLDEEWSDEQRHVVISLLETACRQIEARAVISSAEVEAWDLLDGDHLFARGIDIFATGPVAELGRAVIRLLQGRLTQPTSGKWWFYGPDGVETMAPRE